MSQEVIKNAIDAIEQILVYVAVETFRTESWNAEYVRLTKIRYENLGKSLTELRQLIND